jgi:hypothetical protein
LNFFSFYIEYYLFLIQQFISKIFKLNSTA